MFQKFVHLVKTIGFWATVRRVLRALYYRTRGFFTRLFERNVLKGVNPMDYDAIILFESSFGWGRIMKQRPQQIAENFDSTVLFVYHSSEPKDYTGCKNRVRKLKENLYLVDFGFYRNSLFEQFAAHNNKYLMIYSTDYIPMEKIKLYRDYRYRLIYDYVDDIDIKLCGKEMCHKLTVRHKKIVTDESNLIITTASKLYQNVLKINPNASVHLITNGVNYEHFQKETFTLPEDLREIREKYRKIIGYYGALANWFDYGLLKKMSARYPDYAMVLIGMDYDGSLDNSGILSLPNVFYLGRKDYDSLADYVHYFDACMIPFLINEITLSTSPVKLFEYMAAHKPIITTALPECKKYQSVFYSETDDAFLENVEKALAISADADYQALLDKEAKENTWSAKCRQITSVINREAERLTELKQILCRRLESGEIDRVVIWRSPFGWDVPLYQRPQHIAMAFARKRCLMIYEVTESSDQISDFRVQNDNLILANLTCQEVLDAVMQPVGSSPIPKYVQIYSTNWDMSVKTMKLYIDSGYTILYEYIDDLNPALAGTEQLPVNVLGKYEYMLRDTKNVLVVVTANEIEKDVLAKRGSKNYCFSCNGVDYRHFAELDSGFNFEESFLKIVGNGKINVGYYGALASWFDYELIRQINQTGRYNIVLFGVKYDDSFDASHIDELENVYFLGPKKYEELPQYASKMDILTIPFLINDITNATSPLKLFEYMALGKPVVTTDMPECRKYPSVLIAKTHEEFLEQLEQASLKRNDSEYLALLHKDALDNTWDKKADVILELMKKHEAEH